MRDLRAGFYFIASSWPRIIPGVGGRSQGSCKGRRGKTGREKEQRKKGRSNMYNSRQNWPLGGVLHSLSFQRNAVPPKHQKTSPPWGLGAGGGGHTQLPLWQSPPYHGVFILKKDLSSGFSKQLPRAVQLVLRYKLKKVVLPGIEKDEGQSPWVC